MCRTYLEEQKCTHSLGLETGVKDSISSKLQTETLSPGTLVFKEGPDEPFRSLTMLDLWLSAKSKLQLGEEIDSRRGPDLHPSQCIVHRN